MTRRYKMTLEEDIKVILRKLKSEGLSNEEALAEFRLMRERVADGADPEEILDEIGLEPDFIFGLIDG